MLGVMGKSTYQASACVIFSDSPFAKESDMLSPESVWKGLQNAEGIEGQLNLPCYPSTNRITAYVLHFCCWSHIFLTAHVSYRLLKEKNSWEVEH